MSYQSKVTAVINNPNYGSQVTVNTISTTTNDYGDEIEVITGTSTIYAIPFSYIYERGELVRAGNLNEGEMLMIIPATANVSEGDKVTFDSKTHIVSRVERFPLGGNNLATQILVKEVV